MIHTLLPGVLVEAAANQGYLISPHLVIFLSNLCEYKATILLYELMIMFPDEMVFNLDHMSELMGTVIIDGVQI